MNLITPSRQRKKSLKHAANYYKLAAVKRAARKASLSSQPEMQMMDARTVAGVIPIDAKVCVLSWPAL